MIRKSFSSFGVFATFFEGTVERNIAATLIATEEAGHVVHKLTREVFGDRSKLADLAPSTQAERTRLGFTPNDPLLRSGELRDTVELEVDGNTAVVGSKDPKMAWLEFGTATIPPRPAFEVGLIESLPLIDAIVQKTIEATFGAKRRP